MSLIRVLIIDDSVTMRAILEQVISLDFECEVVGAAGNAEAAAALMRHNHPDVMTLDLAMPGIDGMEFLRSIHGRKHPPVIVVSSISKPGACASTLALAAGAYGCFDKAELLANGARFLRYLKKAARSSPIRTSHVRRRSDPKNGFEATN